MSRQATSQVRQWPHLLAAMVMATTLAGCAKLGPQPESMQPLATDWANRGTVPRAPSVDPAQWWKSFDEPLLDALVAETLEQNLTLLQASNRLQAARALVRTAETQRLPQVGATAEGRRQKRLSGPPESNFERTSEDDLQSPDGSRTSSNFQAGFDASWELDLFGRLTATEEAAHATAGSALAESRMTRVYVVAEVVRNYIELRSAQRRLALQKENLKDSTHLVALTRDRRTAGIVGDIDIDRSLTSASEIAAQLPLLEQSILQSAQRIAVLTGKATIDSSLLKPTPQPVAERLALRVLPADLVRVRPEIQRAERQIAQAGAELGIAIADLYPRMTLAGDITANGNLIGTPLAERATNASAGLSIHIPLLDWGARRAVVNAREAGLTEAIFAYRLAVLEGIEDTENALTAIDTARRKAMEEEIRLAAAQRTASHADTLYQRGITDLHDRLDAATALREAQLSTADVAEQQALAVVALYKAVGGASLEPAH
ncbi:efflux transporter outer membrane subunit [Pseudomonas fluorescens]|uniref:Multidrug/solvent efflux pump outer membrane protein MepC n=1 Tax=Pseudomonas fluorescens TaxID=294 RepID=A0A5E7RF76_PSEFL|nr:efflux transporter outer membrane subunit [Pseudomonas fluorescens]VVN65211.1 Multidrug/solvent efflux pump outer membrane protein MepC [Pseudomonas fluorescens]VVP73082.1 Multidrug/solvent efflux pump outer membrane protein MepC [Pseudomonas fluorescens]